jgi:hypothetical protein
MRVDCRGHVSKVRLVDPRDIDLEDLGNLVRVDERQVPEQGADVFGSGLEHDEDLAAPLDLLLPPERRIDGPPAGARRET